MGSNHPIGVFFRPVWDKTEFRRFVESDHLFPTVVTIDPDYQATLAILAIYDFSKDPLSGRYSSAIFDQKRGIVLCTKKPRELMNALTKKQLLNFSHMRLIAEKLGFRSNHTLFCGRQLYMSLGGLHRRNTDWISLSVFDLTTCDHDGFAMSGKFKLSCCEQRHSLTLSFRTSKLPIRKFVSESVTIGVLCRSYLQEFLLHLGYSVKLPLPKGGAFAQSGYVKEDVLAQVQQTYTVQQINQNYRDRRLSQYAWKMAEMLKVPWFQSDHGFCSYTVRRSDFIE